MAPLPLDPIEPLRRRLQWGLLFRVSLVSVFLGLLAFVYFESGDLGYAVPVSQLLLTIAATYGVTILSAVLLLRLRQLESFAYFQVTLDVVLTTWVIFVTGGADSPFGVLYSLVVVNAAMLLSTPGAVMAASASSIAYAALVTALNLGLIARPDYPFRPAPADLHFAIRFVITNVTFYVIAFLATLLVRRLHQTEQLLQRSEAERDQFASMQEALARHLGSALFTVDTEGRITSLNNLAEELISAAAAEIVGKDIGALFPPLRQTPAGRRQFLQSSAGVLPTEFEYENHAQRQVAVRCSTILLQDTYKHDIGALYIVQDITAFRQLERQLEEQGEVAPTDSSIDDDSENSADGLIGTSPAMGRVREFIDKAARSDATLLITGESGTGKERVARAVHARSARHDKAFVPVNCGAIPENLIESELFGHVRGAFTGAVADRAGLFRVADRGTIFLDEIGDLPLALQVKLLRVLQERTFTPVGADKHVSVDVRVIAATNRDLVEAVRRKGFREDLYYRVNVLPLELPPLRERRQDIPRLVRHFLRLCSALQGKAVDRLSVAAARRLQAYDFPGNVRELENIVEHAVALCEGETIHEEHLPEYVLRAEAKGGEEVLAATTSASVIPPLDPPAAIDNLEDNLAAYERAILLRALAEAGGVKKRAAELLGINYRSFRHRLQKYRLGGVSEQAEDS